jgi:hypothetical protein
MGANRQVVVKSMGNGKNKCGVCKNRQTHMFLVKNGPNTIGKVLYCDKCGQFTINIPTTHPLYQNVLELCQNTMVMDVSGQK